MFGYRRATASTALVLACILGLATGCGGDGGDAEAPAGASPSPTIDPPRSTATATEGGSATSMAQQDDCLNAERRAARRLWLWEAVGEVTRSPSGSSVKAPRTVAKHTAKVERRLQDRCGGRAPAAFTRFSKDIEPIIAAGRFGNRQLDRVLGAWLRWGSAVGAPEAAAAKFVCSHLAAGSSPGSMRPTGSGGSGRRRAKLGGSRSPSTTGPGSLSGGASEVRRGDQRARGPVRLGPRSEGWPGQRRDSELGRLLGGLCRAEAGQDRAGRCARRRSRRTHDR